MNKRQVKKKYKLKYGINPPNKYEKALHSLINWMLVAYYENGMLPEADFLRMLGRCDVDGKVVAMQLWEEMNIA